MQFESEVNYLVGDAVLQPVSESGDSAEDGMSYIGGRNVIRNPDRISIYEQTIRKMSKQFRDEFGSNNCFYSFTR